MRYSLKTDAGTWRIEAFERHGNWLLRFCDPHGVGRMIEIFATPEMAAFAVSNHETGERWWDSRPKEPKALTLERWDRDT